MIAILGHSDKFWLMFTSLELTNGIDTLGYVVNINVELLGGIPNTGCNYGNDVLKNIYI